MYAIIRRYTPKTTATRQNIEDLKRRIEESFVPVVQDIRGFHSYSVLNVGNKDLFSSLETIDLGGYVDQVGGVSETCRHVRALMLVGHHH